MHTNTRTIIGSIAGGALLFVMMAGNGAGQTAQIPPSKSGDNDFVSAIPAPPPITPIPPPITNEESSETSSSSVSSSPTDDPTDDPTSQVTCPLPVNVITAINTALSSLEIASQVAASAQTQLQGLQEMMSSSL